MRLWSLHPCYLDTKGLLAVWREGLLAKHVLEGKTKGYRNHPQLLRFRQQKSPVEAISQYLSDILTESIARGYHFDGTKIITPKKRIIIPVTIGQMEYEKKHLLTKLEIRAPKLIEKLRDAKSILSHPMFEVRPGEIESWEKGP